MRLIADSFPRKIRNSYFAFKVAKYFFKLPNSLYYFRENYDRGIYKDLSIFYKPDSPFYLRRTSFDTDINSIHLKHIMNLIKKKKPESIFDVGCGSGYLINLINNQIPNKSFSVLDFNIPDLLKNKKNIKYFEGDIKSNLINISDNKYELVICTHVIEHISDPDIILKNLRRISSNYLLIICPIEKKFKWGLNYHINFFEESLSFLKFINKDINHNKDIRKNFYYVSNLGDILYQESYL